MESKNFRNYAIGIGAIVLVCGLVFVTVWLLVFPQEKSADLNLNPTGVNIYAYCDPIKGGYVLSVAIDNYYGKEDIKNVHCEIALKGDLSSDLDKYALGDIFEAGRNDCYFLLKGDYEGPVSARVSYDDKMTMASAVCRQATEWEGGVDW